MSDAGCRTGDCVDDDDDDDYFYISVILRSRADSVRSHVILDQ